MSQRLSPLDACWLHMEAATNPMMVTGVLWFDTLVPFERLLELISARLVDRYPRFGWRVVEPALGVGPPHWEADPDFDLHRHVHRVALVAPGGRTELQDLVGDLMSTQLDLRRSPWELHVVEGFGTGFALVVRIHHCVADGISLARVLLSLADGEPAERETEPALPTARERLQRARELATRAIGASADAVGHPGRLARWITEETGTALRLLTLPPDPPSPLRGPLGVRKVCAWSDPIPLDTIKAIGRATGSTVNDVLVSALSGTLRGWLGEHHCEVDELRAFVPVNLRPLDQPIPADLGNLFSMVVLELPVGIADPRQRLAAVHARMEELKHSHDPEVVFALLHAMGASPPAVERLFVDFLGKKATAVVTNVPGPRQPIHLAGAQVAGLVVWVPQSGDVALGVSIFSYAGQVVMGVATDAGLVPRPGELAERLAGEVEALR